MMKNILIVDDDMETSLKYKKWLEDEEGFNLTLINDPEIAEVNFKPQNYDLVLIGFRMSVVNGFDLYHKLHGISQKVEHTPKEFKICFMTSSRINYEALAEVHPELEKNAMFPKKFQKKFL